MRLHASHLQLATRLQVRRAPGLAKSGTRKVAKVVEGALAEGAEANPRSRRAPSQVQGRIHAANARVRAMQGRPQDRGAGCRNRRHRREQGRQEEEAGGGGRSESRRKRTPL